MHCFLAETIPPQFTPRIKHYAIKAVCFREEINKHGIKLFKIDTKEQLGDIFTKGLPRATFEYLRIKLMGWSGTHISLGLNTSLRGSIDIGH